MDEASAADSRRRSSSPTPRARASSTSRLARSSWTPVRARTTVPPWANPHSMASVPTTRPTSPTVSIMARRTAAPEPGPPIWSSLGSGTANSAEHQPPLRPEAPNPTTSRSITAMRRLGSASAR